MSKLRFTKEHEWVRIDGDDAVCGITGYAQKALGDIVYVELPPLGKQVAQGTETAVVESAKAASEIYAPLSGTVTAVNELLSKDPGKVNAAAMSEGWIFKLKPADVSQLDSLMDEAAYERFVAELKA